MQPTNVLEAIATHEAFSIDPPAVRVVRTFSRVIDLGYVSDHVAAGVFKAGRAWPNPDRHRFDRADQPTRLVAAASREFVALHKELIGLAEFQPLQLPPEERPNLWQALRELFQMIQARIRRLPSDLADATLGKAHDHLAAMIDRYRGPEAAKTLRWRERPEDERSLVDLTAELDHPLFTPDGATAAVWRDLRQLSLGLIDGAPLPEGIEEETYVRADKRMLVTGPDAIAPDPEVRPPVAGVERACDPLRLEPRFAMPKDEGASEDGSGDEHRKKLEEWARRLRPTLLWSVGVEIASALETAKTAAEELDRRLATAEQAAQESEKETEGVETGEREESEKEPAEAAGEGNESSRWRALRNRFLVYSSLGVLASVVAWTELTLLPAGGAQLAIMGAWTAAMLTVAVRFVRTEREIARKAILAQLDIVNAATRRALQAGDLPRLERRYAEYLDWAEIIGWMAHHPWVGEPVGRVEVKAPVRQSTLPSAFRVGAAVVPPQRIEALCAKARAKVFDTGWLTEQYQASLERSQQQVALSQAYGVGGGSTDPDADVLEDPDSPRRLLREAIRRGDGRHLKDNELTEEVLRFMNQLPLDGTASGVSTSLALWSSGTDGDDQLEALPPCPAWFAPPQGMSELVPHILAGVTKISANTLSGPQVGFGTLLSGGGVVTSHRVVDGATTIRVQLPDGSSCDAAVARVLPEADLALLELEGAPEVLDGGFELSDREPQLGEPVLAPSPPERDPDQPEVALGLLVRGGAPENGTVGPGSADFGVTYRSAAGPAGSPVFDLTGRLLGVHRSVQGGSDTGTSAIRAVAGVGELRALLEAGDAGAAVEAGQALPVTQVAGARVEAPSRFLDALFSGDSESIGLLPQHWTDSDEQHMPNLTLGFGEFGFATLEELAVPMRFLQPVRVIVHRVDISSAMAARELASCASRESSAV